MLSQLPQRQRHCTNSGTRPPEQLVAELATCNIQYIALLAGDAEETWTHDSKLLKWTRRTGFEDGKWKLEKKKNSGCHVHEPKRLIKLNDTGQYRLIYMDDTFHFLVNIRKSNLAI